MANVTRYSLDIEGSKWLALPSMSSSGLPVFLDFSEISTTPRLCIVQDREGRAFNTAGSGDFHVRIAWPTETLDPKDPPCIFTKSFHGLLRGHDQECLKASERWTMLRSAYLMAFGSGGRGTELLEGGMVAMERLPHTAQAIRMFLHHWPNVDDTNLISRPKQLPGGIESINDTIRHFPRRPVLSPEKTPAWTVRRVHNLHPFRSRELSQLVAQIEEILGLTQDPLQANRSGLAIIRLRKELRHLRVNLQKPIGSRDAPLPTWPLEARELRRELKMLLHSPTRSSVSDGSTGIIRAEDAYEAWCGVSLIEALDESLGPHHHFSYSSRSSIETWMWIMGEFQIHLAYQYTFGKDPGNDFLPEFKSVTSVLRPDFCLITRTKSGDVVGLHLIDPKLWKVGQIPEHGGSRYIAEASKYLWGIRRCGLPISEASFVSDVALISPPSQSGKLPEPISPVEARCTALAALPDCEGRNQIKRYIMQLLVKDGILNP